MHDFSREVWFNTYRYNKAGENSISDTFKRVADAVGQDEYQRTEFFKILNEYMFCPGGRILSNAGTDFAGTTLFNCYVGPKPKYDQDSLEGIAEILLTQMQTLKSEGGWGMNFSFLRPRGALIKKIGVETPGSVKYMELYNKASDIITAGSGKEKTGEKDKKNRIRKGAMMGVLDCVAKGTLIWTLNGKIPVENLVNTNPLVYCTDGNGNVKIRKANKVWSKGVRSTIRIKFDNDNYLICTPDHEVMLSNGFYKQAKDLTFGDSVAVLHKVLYKNYYQIGVTGKRKSIPEHIAVCEYKYGRYPIVKIKNGSIQQDSEDVHHIDENPINNDPDNLVMLSRSDHIKMHNNFKDTLDRARDIVNKKRRGKTWEEFYGKERSDEIKSKFKKSKKANNKPVWNKGLSGDEYKKKYKNGFTNQFVSNANHKVISVEAYQDLEVYDVSVPEFHNFVANDIFVHNCWHPDIEEFIEAKRTANKLDKFNVSVGCYNDFMNLVTEVEETGIDKQWDLVFPDTTCSEYSSQWDGDIYTWKEKGLPVIVHKTVSVKSLWEKIMKSTYDFNDPGVLFLDRANETYLNNYVNPYAIRTSNPCGEQMLIYGGVCDLGSLCLPFLLNDDYTGFDFKKVRFATRRAVEFLDRVNDISNTPCEEYGKNARSKRRIGLGIMGWGSALYLLKKRFGSKEAEQIKSDLMRCITLEAVAASIELAISHGPYDGCDKDKLADHPFWKQIKLPSDAINAIRKYGMRNSALFSIQPTGNTSILFEVVSGGCEPVFLHEYIRTTIIQSPPDHIKELCPKYWQGEFVETEMFKFAKEGDETILRGVDENGVVYKIDKNRGLTKEVLCEDYGVKILKERGEWNSNADWAVTTNNLTVHDHITDLKGWAKWIDSSISKTINLPNNYPYDDFKRIYLEAYKSGVIKGITTYRDGTMTSVLSSVEKKEISTKKRPKKLPCDIHHPTIKGMKYYVAIGLDDNDKPYEIFAGENGIDKDISSGFIQRIRNGRYSLIADNEVIIEDMGERCSNEEEAVARLASISLRNGVEIQSIVDQLEKTKGSLSGFAKVMCRILRKYIPESAKCNDQCPECKDNLVYQEGCKKCVNCGFSKC